MATSTARALLELLMVPVASAVNYLTITPSATGNPGLVSAVGTDTNIGIELTPKGTGPVSTPSGTNVMLGATTARATTQPTNAINIFNGTAPAGTLANGATFYAGAGEMNVMDAAGNITLLSPHDANGEWVYRSRNDETGKKIEIRMESMMRALDEMLGGGFISE